MQTEPRRIKTIRSEGRQIASNYTAIIAEIVGTSGAVTAFEIDEELAARARQNLKD